MAPLPNMLKPGAEYLHNKPAYLTWEQAAAFPLAGLTTYRALFTKGKAQKGDTVLINGAGGGTATFALQFALAAGCRGICNIRYRRKN